MVDVSRLEPGKLDGAARRVFITGACAALALALHRKTGWPIVGITDAHNVHDGRLGGGSSLHWAVLRPDGRLVDVEGSHDPADLVERYDGYADDGEAAWAVGSEADIREWYVEAQGEPVPAAVAATFVEPLLEEIAAREAAPPAAP